MSLALALLAACALFAACAAQFDPVLKHKTGRPKNLGDVTQCGSDHIGAVPAGNAVPLPAVFIPPGQQDAEIKIDDNCPLYGWRLAGELATACDDAVPQVRLVSSDRAYVHRRGSLADSAPVLVTQYCV